MADPKQVKILKRGGKAWNRWREEQPENVRIDLSTANLQRAELGDADLSRADLSYADLHSADLSRVNLRDANLSHADLSRAILRGATLCRANLDEVLLFYANLRGANLSTANLSHAELRYSDLCNANLQDANLYSADLRVADLSDAILGSADLRQTNLNGANFRGAYLHGTDLESADLRAAILVGADLHNADLRNATLAGSILANMDLRETKGLTNLHHIGQSHIELHTVQLPQDSSTLHFLRGCGVPDEWIDDYRTRMMHPIQYHSCFISYSSKDEIFARRLHADLQAQGVRCWFAPHDMKIGDKIRSRIDKAIHMQDKLLLLISEYALASEWVEDEVEAALEKERRQQREVLFPVRLDDTVMVTNEAWAAKLRRARHIGDFTHWTDPQVYEQAFNRLLHDLKAENSAGGDTDGE